MTTTYVRDLHVEPHVGDMFFEKPSVTHFLSRNSQLLPFIPESFMFQFAIQKQEE
jgi:hypothetical protein